MTVYAADVLYTRDRVTWDRQVPAGNDAEANPITQSADGFPLDDVRGRFQPRSATPAKTPAGEDTFLVGVFYSDTYLDGRQGDIVTLDNGDTYNVLGVVTRKHPLSNSVAHARYDLAVRTQGAIA